MPLPFFAPHETSSRSRVRACARFIFYPAPAGAGPAPLGTGFEHANPHEANSTRNLRIEFGV